MQSFEAIPELLRNKPRWLNWRYVQRDGAEKPTKVPLNPNNGQPGDVMDPTTFGTFAAAVSNASRGLCDGIGFVLGEGIAGVDLDNDPRSKDYNDPAKLKVFAEIMSKFATYQEVSPSGNGLHIIFTHTDGLEGGRRKNGVELYFSKRFLTFTGNVFNGCTTVNDCTTYGAILLEEMGGIDGARDNGVDEPEREPDNVIIERAATAANGPDFRALWFGQWLHHPSQSEADQHLMNIIAVYTNNRDQAKRIFCQSGLAATLQRKGNPANYLDLTVRKAFDQKLPAEVYEKTARDLAELLKLDPRKPAALASVGSDGEPAIKPNRLEAPPWPGGLMGEIANFIHEQAPHQMADAAIIGAIGLMAGICGRSYNVNGDGLNLYVLLVAKTGRGKEAINSGISKLIQAVKGGPGEGMSLDMVPAADTFYGPAVLASSQGLSRVIEKQQSFVSVIGEFGIYLQNMTGDRVSANDRALKRAILELYGKSGAGNSYKGAAYSDTTKNIDDVSSPAFSLIGETTPTTFYEILSESMIAEGLLPRFIVWEYDGPRTHFNEASSMARPSPGLVQRLRQLVVTSMDRNRQNLPINVQLDPEAATIFRDFGRFATDQVNAGGREYLDHLWSRAYVKMQRLAALGAVGMNMHAPVIGRDIALWAKTIVVRDIQAMSHKFETGATGDQRESNRLRYVLRLMREFVRDPKVSDTYKQKREYHAAHIVPLAYLSKRCSPHNSFKTVPHRSSYAVLKDTIDALLQRGEIHETPSAILAQTVGSNARAFTLDPSALHDD